LGEGQLRDFFRVLGLVVDAVGRPEENGLTPMVLSIKRWVRFSCPMNFSFRDVVKAGMGVGCDCRSRGLRRIRALRSAEIGWRRHRLRRSCRNVLFLEDVEDFGVHRKSGPSSKVMAILLSAAPIWSMLYESG